MPAALHALLPWRAWDEASELYVNAASTGFVVELPPFAGIDAEALGALAGTLADAAPERCTIQVIHWASRVSVRRAGPGRSRAPAAGGALARMGARRSALLAPGGWRRLHAGGPPFTLCDYRVFVTACLAGVRGRRPRPRSAPSAGRSKAPSLRRGREPAAWSRTRCSRWRRNSWRRILPDLATAGPNAPRGAGRRAIRSTEQCAAPGRALTVAPTGLTFHHPDGEDVAVRVLSAVAFPEVWPGWRGNALIGDFHRDFLQPARRC